MSKIQNWLLTAFVVIGGILDIGFGILNEFAAEMNIEPKVVTYVRFAIAIVGAVLLKLQPPSTNPDKLQKLVEKAEEKKAK